LPDVAQQRIRADWETQLGSQPGASFTAQCKPDGFQALLLPDRPSTIYSGYLIQTFGKYLSRAVAIGAIELASGDLPVNLLTSPRQIRQSPVISAMDSVGKLLAPGALSGG
jgi:hypothetical protein